MHNYGFFCISSRTLRLYKPHFITLSLETTMRMSINYVFFISQSCIILHMCFIGIMWVWCKTFILWASHTGCCQGRLTYVEGKCHVFLIIFPLSYMYIEHPCGKFHCVIGWLNTSGWNEMVNELATISTK